MDTILNGYVAIKGGAVKNATKEVIGNAQVVAGVRADTDTGLFGQVELGYGNAFQFKGEAGKDFYLNNNLDLTVSGGWQYLESKNTSSYYKKTFGEEGNSPNWHAKDFRIYANTGVKLTGNWGELGVGIQGGMKDSEKPDLPPEGLDGTAGETKGTDITGSRTRAYITPTVNSKINLSKNISLNLNAALDQGSVGIAWNF